MALPASNGKSRRIRNPEGRPKGYVACSEIIEARKFTKLEIEEKFREMLGHTAQSLKYIVKHEDYYPALDRALAKVMIKAVDEANISCLGFMLDRLIGKVSDNSSMVFDIGAQQIIERTPEQLEAEKADRGTVYEVLMSEAAKFKYPRPKLISGN